MIAISGQLKNFLLNNWQKIEKKKYKKFEFFFFILSFPTLCETQRVSVASLIDLNGINSL